MSLPFPTSLHPCNFADTGGMFGQRRLLATYRLHPVNVAARTRYAVFDDMNPAMGAVSFVETPERAVELFGRQDEWRMHRAIVGAEPARKAGKAQDFDTSGLPLFGDSAKQMDLF